MATFALPLAGWWMNQPILLWSAFVPAIALALIAPSRLVLGIAVTTPTFPVLRLANDAVGAGKVSSKGMFLFADDPLILALAIAWLLTRLRYPGDKKRLYPSALFGLAMLYPVVILLNAFRLESNQVLVSGLYYLKWLQYGCLLVLVPQTLRGPARARLAGQYLRIVCGVSLAAAAFGAFELFESVRNGTYNKAASFPRVSSFFGSLDPTLYGASEDPVNFGVWAVVMGSLVMAAIAAGARSNGLFRFSALLAAGFSLLASVSRAPVIAAIAAYSRIQRLNSTRLILPATATCAVTLTAYVAAPDLVERTASRFAVIADWGGGKESSAESRLDIALHSPVFEVDQYWLTGHGHSTYRFVAEQHLARVHNGLSRSLYSFPLTAWYDAGPLGLALWVLLFRQLGSRLRSIRDSSEHGETAALARGLCAALWALAAASLFGEVPYNWRVMGSFYLGVAICLAADEGSRQGIARLRLRHRAAPPSVLVRPREFVS
ncbi:MAG: hypothetical protein R2729_08180 [Bryobacteraceae bacterium]